MQSKLNYLKWQAKRSCFFHLQICTCGNCCFALPYPNSRSKDGWFNLFKPIFEEPFFMENEWNFIFLYILFLWDRKVGWNAWWIFSETKRNNLFQQALDAFHAIPVGFKCLKKSKVASKEKMKKYDKHLKWTDRNRNLIINFDFCSLSL
jgi:hypothetical protein